MDTTTKQKAYLLLEDGLLFEGTAIGKNGTKGGEICFNTGMTGYQEIYTDPSYTGQIIVNTNSHIGNYGVIEDENESDYPKISGIVVNDYSPIASRQRSNESLQQYLERHEVTGIADIDTRMLVRHIRSKGAMNAIISSELNPDELKKELAKVPSMDGLELSSKVCTKERKKLGDENAEFKVAVLDLGIKNSILKNLISRGVYCEVFPAKSTFEDLKSFNPDGYFISNGPGDPSVMDYAVETVKEILKEDKPLFGICLGHQILARACGIGTYKMHHGHRGLNHPILNLGTGKSEITSQNHGFVVSAEDIEKSDKVEVTHRHLNDDTVAGIKVKGKNAFSVQYHPEASPGPHDSRYLFDQFIELMKSKK
ncbi:glutamine-hydrolyzing carbamoyl-phosphate synthase small subunit [Fulvivirga lutea]|uniref:Carbamoyl phosphate synthase small chain n=1 Tax=Fulvivirga lutea TaxID=2810512 RepID=A0A975A1F5_9BACT|nr:glutamine-hydrolyzing carbamoyl-phosphate synthase small subunit [Fulvivirga lutea]QSE97766.1 glutamine-hydrolyzing carbamoyl-phosphate synthase small subunit [Fulvivirga lutea]